MVKPGVNQVALMSRSFRNVRMRPEAMAPNSPRDSGGGVAMPRAMKPDWVSKSKVRQTIWRGMRKPALKEALADHHTPSCPALCRASTPRLYQQERRGWPGQARP